MMKITPIQTKIVQPHDSLVRVITEALPTVNEGSVIAVTSKIVSLCEGRIFPAHRPIEELIAEEADYYLPMNDSQYRTYLTVKRNCLIPNAGIDYSNAHHSVLLWPEDVQRSANELYDALRAHYNVEKLGIIITDSAPSPLQWGVTGIAIAHCGFTAVLSKEGATDLFGRELVMTKINTAHALAAAAVLCMGETDECTPIALIEEPMNTQFQDGHPSREELDSMAIALEDDLYSQLLTAVNWRKK